MKAAFLILALAVSPLFGQSARVIPLDPSDAAEAASLYAQRDIINSSISNFEKEVKTKYLTDRYDRLQNTLVSFSTVTASAPKTATEEEKKRYVWYLRSGWEQGFEFSSDFKFIVPAPYTPPKQPSYGFSNGNNCLTFTTN